jgi:fermentation-respiration switch protein FrsA (DUF1100 family)
MEMATKTGAGTRRSLRPLLLAALVVALIVAIPVALVERRLRPPRVELTDDPATHGLAADDIAFASLSDGVTLRGWYVPAHAERGGSTRTVVITPGIDANREMDGVTLALAPALLAAGWNVLAFDPRAEGQSDGATQTLGWSERWDVLGAVAEARRRGAERVVGLGSSMGGAATILAAADSPAIDAVIADSAYTRLDTALRHELEVDLRLPGPLASVTLWLSALLAGFDPAASAPVERIDQLAPRPVLLIHGTADRTVPADACRELADAAGPNATCWLVDGAGHTAAFTADPSAYTERVLAFLALVSDGRVQP